MMQTLTGQLMNFAIQVLVQGSVIWQGLYLLSIGFMHAYERQQCASWRGFSIPGTGCCSAPAGMHKCARLLQYHFAPSPMHAQYARIASITKPYATAAQRLDTGLGLTNKHLAHFRLVPCMTRFVSVDLARAVQPLPGYERFLPSSLPALSPAAHYGCTSGQG